MRTKDVPVSCGRREEEGREEEGREGGIREKKQKR
jgi:hypothetical protein